MPSGRVCVTLMASGWLRVFRVVAPSKALVEGVVAREVLKLATARGSHTPKARWMAFLGISRLSICIWISVLLDMTSARKFLSDSSSLSPATKSFRCTGSCSSTLGCVLLNVSRKYDGFCANAPAARRMPVVKVLNSICLLVTNGLDGIQFRGLYGRINSKQQTDEHADAEGHHNR